MNSSPFFIHYFIFADFFLFIGYAGSHRKTCAGDPLFGTTLDELKALMHPANFVGRAPQQTEEFVAEQIRPILDRYADELGLEVEINV